MAIERVRYEGWENSRGVPEPREGDGRECWVREGEALEEVVDGEVGATADEDALVLRDEVADYFDERLGLPRSCQRKRETVLARECKVSIA